MGAGATVSFNAMGALSYGCGIHPLGYKFALSHFATGGLGGTGVTTWSWGPRGNCGWWKIAEKTCDNPIWWSGRTVCITQTSTGGKSHVRATGKFKIPTLEKYKDGELRIVNLSRPEFVEKQESSTFIAKQNRPGRRSNETRDQSIDIRDKGNEHRETGKPPVKVNLATLDPRSRRLASAKVPNKGSPMHSKAARRFFNEKFRAEPQRLSKVLAAAGVASRRACEEVISSGRVAVNGNVCIVPQTPVDPLKDNIYVDGHSLPKKAAPKLYFAVNKPKGYICSTEGTKPVLSLFDEYFKVWMQRNPGLAKPRMFTVGRLDVATSGLLLVTNDGEFAQKVSHPSSGLTKEYVVTVNERVTRKQMQVIACGTVVQGTLCVPQEVELLDLENGEERQRLRVVVVEGRNHEVRHLVENAGLEVLALKRVRIGDVRLSRKLGLGKFDRLTDVQVAKLIK